MGWHGGAWGIPQKVTLQTLVADKVIGNGLNLPHTVKKSAGAGVQNSHNAVASSAAAAYTKVKTITFTNGLLGAQRFLFDIKTSDVAKTAYGKVYRNGAAIGTEQSTASATYVTKSEDLTQDWNPDDTCELWIHNDGVGITSVQNFQIGYADSATVAVASANS